MTASRVLVMPFETATREPRSYWLGEGSAVILTDSLLALGLPVMWRDERLHSFELLRVPLSPGLSHATIIRDRPGRRRVAGDRRHVHARRRQSHRSREGDRARHRPAVPEMSESGPLADIFDIYDRLAVRLVPGPHDARVCASTSVILRLLRSSSSSKGCSRKRRSTKLSFLSEALRLAPGLHRARLALGMFTPTSAITSRRSRPSGGARQRTLERQARFLRRARSSS